MFWPAVQTKGYGQDVSGVVDRAALAAAAVGAGACALESRGALRPRVGARGARPEHDLRGLRRGARCAAVSSDDDDGAASVCVFAGGVLVAEDRASVRGARGFHGGDGVAAAGLSDGEQVPAAASAGARRSFQTSSPALPEGGDGDAGACGPRWDEDQSQREQAQGDELRADAQGRSAAGGGGEAVVFRSRGGRPSGRRRAGT